MNRIGEKWQRCRPKTASERKLIRERLAELKKIERLAVREAAIISRGGKIKRKAKR